MSMKIEVARTIGENLPSVMSRTLSKSIYEVFKEFVSNSYDADAENVNVTVNTLEDLLIIEDDGTGMDEKTIKNFYRLGDSVKLDQKVTAKGREPIGQFGIATILLPSLGASYTLETWKDGKKITIKESFVDDNVASLPISFTVTDDNEHEHGTRITITGLRIKDGSYFNMERLRNVLQWEMPTLEDFSMNINGKPINKPKVPSDARYHFEFYVDKIGKVVADFNYTAIQNKHAGIYVYVRGRVVGDSKMIDPARISTNLGGRIIGFIDAPGLHPYVSFDRSSFQESSPEYQALLEEIYQQLRQVNEDIPRIRKESEAKRISYATPRALEMSNAIVKGIAPSSLQNIDEHENKAAAPSLLENDNALRHGISLDELQRIRDCDNEDVLSKGLTQSSSATGLEFRLVDRGTDEVLAIYDARQNVVLVNAAHPYFNVAGSGSQVKNMQVKFLTAAADAIASHVFAADTHNNSAVSHTLADWKKSISSLARAIFQDREAIISVMQSGLKIRGRLPITAYRMYTIDEVAYHLGLAKDDAESMAKSNILISRTDNSFYFGEDLLNVLKQVIEYIPATQLVREYLVRQRRTNAKKEVDKIISKIIPYTLKIDYLKDIGCNGGHFYMVKLSNKDSFLALLDYFCNESGNMPLPHGLSGKNGASILPEESYVTLRQAANVLGTDLPGLFGLFDKACLSGRTVSKKAEHEKTVYDLAELGRLLNGE